MAKNFPANIERHIAYSCLHLVAPKQLPNSSQNECKENFKCSGKGNLLRDVY